LDFPWRYRHAAKKPKMNINHKRAWQQHFFTQPVLEARRLHYNDPVLAVEPGALALLLDPERTSSLVLAWPATRNRTSAREDTTNKALVAFGLCLALSGTALAQQKTAKEQIVGAWTLVAVTSEMDGKNGLWSFPAGCDHLLEGWPLLALPVARGNSEDCR
jgi:hypothetical protein